MERNKHNQAHNLVDTYVLLRFFPSLLAETPHAFVIVSTSTLGALLNILSILTLEFSFHLLKSRLKFSVSPNIEYILFTFDTSQLFNEY